MFKVQCIFEINGGKSQVKFDYVRNACRLPVFKREIFNQDECLELKLTLQLSPTLSITISNSLTYCNYPSVIESIQPPLIYLADYL